MAYDIIIGRDAADKQTFGEKGLIYLGKGYVKMGNTTSLSNKIWMDVARSHVILIAGKRGSGKSYSLSSIAEELSSLPAENAKNIASLIFDTMGIFWTMKYKNEKDRLLLEQWDLKAKNLPVKVFVPAGKATDYATKGISFDAPFALKVTEVEAEDWTTLFNLEFTSLPGILIERVLSRLKGSSYTISSILQAIEKDSKALQETKEITTALFEAAESWGIFASSTQSTEIADLITPAATTVLDISIYGSSETFNIRGLVTSLVCKKLFKNRMDARKKEELEAIQHGRDYLLYRSTLKDPLVWVFIDEAHEFLPRDSTTPATAALLQLLREGRQPGISLVLATQQPGQIHRDVMTQSDIIIAHKVTAKADIAALNDIMQSYALESIRQQLDELPPLKGSAIILDDNSERITPMRVRPKFTWHGGESPTSVAPEPKI